MPGLVSSRRFERLRVDGIVDHGGAHEPRLRFAPPGFGE